MFGMYKKLRNEFTGVLTGKGACWGGSLIRPEATGYGAVYFAAEMLAAQGKTLDGTRSLVSGSGNVAQFTMEKLLQLGSIPVTFSDSSGYIYDEAGVTGEKLAFIKHLKNVRRGRVREYAEQYPEAVFTPVDYALGYNPLWAHKAECAFPCATQNEINVVDAQHMVDGGSSWSPRAPTCRQCTTEFAFSRKMECSSGRARRPTPEASRSRDWR